MGTLAWDVRLDAGDISSDDASSGVGQYVGPGKGGVHRALQHKPQLLPRLLILKASDPEWFGSAAMLCVKEGAGLPARTDNDL